MLDFLASPAPVQAFSTGNRAARVPQSQIFAAAYAYCCRQAATLFRIGGNMTLDSATLSSGLSVFLADTKPIENQLLSSALRHQGFNVVSSSENDDNEIPEMDQVDVVIVSCARAAGQTDMNRLRSLHLSHPRPPKIALLESDDRESVVQAFRAGARGIFCLAESSFALLCQCILRVHQGEISASSQQLNYLLDSVCQVPGVRVLGASGHSLLTYREEQVMALVADGLTNRDVATELGLSEHTIKKYLFRIFDKLGISNRVELVLYAVHHGLPQEALAVGA
jgi:DNA-binding NarL/FixJ family response regulator